jgi:hypothetical protein
MNPAVFEKDIFSRIEARLDRFLNKNLKFLPTDGMVSFIWADGRPNGDVYSDHLPSRFQLVLRRRARNASN